MFSLVSSFARRTSLVHEPLRVVGEAANEVRDPHVGIDGRCGASGHDSLQNDSDASAQTRRAVPSVGQGAFRPRHRWRAAPAHSMRRLVDAGRNVAALQRCGEDLPGRDHPDDHPLPVALERQRPVERRPLDERDDRARAGARARRGSAATRRRRRSRAPRAPARRARARRACVRRGSSTLPSRVGIGAPCGSMPGRPARPPSGRSAHPTPRAPAARPRRARGPTGSRARVVR